MARLAQIGTTAHPTTPATTFAMRISPAVDSGTPAGSSSGCANVDSATNTPNGTNTSPHNLPDERVAPRDPQRAEPGGRASARCSAGVRNAAQHGDRGDDREPGLDHQQSTSTSVE